MQTNKATMIFGWINKDKRSSLLAVGENDLKNSG